MTPMRAAAAIAVMALVTFLTRALPFLLFGRGGNPPRIILYLGSTCPPPSSPCSSSTACGT